MKKVIALFLSLVFILSASISANAFDPYPPDYFEEEFSKVKAEIQPIFEEYFKEKTGGNEVLDITIKGINIKSSTLKSTTFTFTSDGDEQKEYFNRFDIFFEKTPYTHPLFPSGYVVYEFESGEFMSRQEAGEKGLVNLFNAASNGIDFKAADFCIVGAVATRMLNIISVTVLQMDLAKETSEYDVRTVDFNKDGKFNIKDATDIQKYLVGTEI